MVLFKHKEYESAGSLTSNPTSSEWNNMVDRIQDAGSGIITKHITINASGSGFVKLGELSTAERNNLSAETGAVIWHTEGSSLQVYDGSDWKDLSMSGQSSINSSNFSGSSCSGSDGGTGRVLDVGETGVFQVMLERELLRPETDYSVSGSVVTFDVTVYNVMGVSAWY